MKKLLILGAFLVISLVLVSGVKSEPNKPATETQKKSITITMIGKSSTNPVFLSGRIGAEAKATIKENSATYTFSHKF